MQRDRVFGAVLLLASCGFVPQANASADTAGKIAVLGAGTVTCLAWTAEHASNSVAAGIQNSWVFGYITGFNSWAPGTNDASQAVDNPELLAWMGTYCEKNPVDTISQASSALIFALYLNASSHT